MNIKVIIVCCLTVAFLWSCNSNQKSDLVPEPTVKDSLQTAIEEKVLQIIQEKDSLIVIPSLRYSKGASETYTVQSYNSTNEVKLIIEESFSNDKIAQRAFYLDNGYPIFIKESTSIFEDSTEVYTERKIYLNQSELYKVYEKHSFAEVFMFDDTTFHEGSVNIAEYNYQNAINALQQSGKFALHFDDFLLIDPQSYLILETADSTMNVALFIKQGDSILNVLFENPDKYKGTALKVKHYFEEMNGIERMIYNGAFIE